MNLLFSLIILLGELDCSLQTVIINEVYTGEENENYIELWRENSEEELDLKNYGLVMTYHITKMKFQVIIDLSGLIWRANKKFLSLDLIKEIPRQVFHIHLLHM